MSESCNYVKVSPPITALLTCYWELYDTDLGCDVDGDGCVVGVSAGGLVGDGECGGASGCAVCGGCVDAGVVSCASGQGVDFSGGAAVFGAVGVAA